VTKEDSLPGGEEEGRAVWWAWKRGTSHTRTYFLEGRKREERVGKLENVACPKRRLTIWRGGRGRHGLVSWKRGTSQTRTHRLEGRKREEGLVNLEMWHVTN
jgi:hypothetical protein